MKTKETSICHKCGSNGKPSKGYMNFHNIQTSNRSKEFETKLLDCIKCESCGHSWIPNKTTREQALDWWKQLCLSCELDDTHYVLDSLIRKHIGFERRYHSLTGREIEEIWLKETSERGIIITNLSKQILDKPKEGKTYSFKPNQKQDSFSRKRNTLKRIANATGLKQNQKQFKQFNESLFQAYINKFSDEDKLKAINCLGGFTIDQTVRAYSCGYGDRDANLPQFHGEKPVNYLNKLKH